MVKLTKGPYFKDLRVDIHVFNQLTSNYKLEDTTQYLPNFNRLQKQPDTTPTAPKSPLSITLPPPSFIYVYLCLFSVKNIIHYVGCTDRLC